jgi:hypothetical protein
MWFQKCQCQQCCQQWHKYWSCFHKLGKRLIWSEQQWSITKDGIFIMDSVRELLDTLSYGRITNLLYIYGVSNHLLDWPQSDSTRMRKKLLAIWRYNKICWTSLNSFQSCGLSPSKNIKIKIYRITILPLVLYRCETWYRTLREEHRLWVIDKRVSKKIHGYKKDEVSGKETT